MFAIVVRARVLLDDGQSAQSEGGAQKEVAIKIIRSQESMYVLSCFLTIPLPFLIVCLRMNNN